MEDVLRFGAIVYTRDRVVASSAHWDVAAERSGATYDQAIRAAVVEFIDEPFEGGSAGSELTKEFEVEQESDVQGVLHEAVGYLKSGGPLNKIVIAGFGPFVASREGQSEIGALTDIPDSPFSDLPIRKIVADAAGAELSSVRLITDVSAMAVAEYWLTWLRQDDPDHRLPNVPAAIIVEEGIGGAVVQRYGDIVGQNHHAEMGHIPVKRHHVERLSTPRCNLGHPHCLTAFAGRPAAYARANGFKEGSDRITAWDIEAFYLAQLCATVVHVIAPTKIVLGGNLVEEAPELIEKIRHQLPSMVEGMPYPQLDVMRTFVTGVDRRDYMINGALLYGLQARLRPRAR